MKKKVFLITSILIFVVAIVAYIAAIGFVEANKDADVQVEMSEDEAKDLFNLPQTKSGEEDYEPLTDAEKQQLGKYYTKGDLDNNHLIDAEDAKIALNIYVKTILGQTRRQTKGEIYTGDITNDGKVSLDDAQILLNYTIEVSYEPNLTVMEYAERYQK